MPRSSSSWTRTTFPVDFAIFCPASLQVAPVHPDRDHLVADRALALRDLVLVVGEPEVDAPGVDVEAFAQVLHRHRRALDVPSGEPLAPRRVPLHQPARPGGLPQGEVGRGPLAAVGLEVPVARAEVVERVPAELPVAGERRDVVVHAAGVHHVGMAALDQGLGELDHLGDVLGGLRVQVGGPDPERGGVVEHRLGVLLGDLERARGPRPPSRAASCRSPPGLGLVRHVTDVGDVHHLGHAQPLELEGPTDQVARAGRCAGSRGACTDTRWGRTCTSSRGPVRPGRPRRGRV